MAAVRRGLRTALPTASRAGGPPNRPVSAPSRRTSAGTSSGAPSRIPTNDNSPPPIPIASAAMNPVSVIAPSRAAPPASTHSTARIVRTIPARDRAPAASSGRSAASGDTLVARRAGASAASTVVTRPTTSGTAIPAGVTTSPPAGMPSDDRPSRTTASPASPVPTAIPATEATRPSSSDSTTTDPKTCRRRAPTQRSRASSRVRWASRMVNVLATTSVATKTAMPANPSSRPPSTSTPLVNDLTCSSVRWAAVCTVAPLTSSRSRSVTAVRSAPGAVRTSTSP